MKDFDILVCGFESSEIDDLFLRIKKNRLIYFFHFIQISVKYKI